MTTARLPGPVAAASGPESRYKWVALFTITLGTLRSVDRGAGVHTPPVTSGRLFLLVLRRADLPQLGGMGMFIAPNQAGVMNALPANQRGAGGGMSGTFNASAQVLSIGIFFTLMILGLAATLPADLYHGLIAQGVGSATALRVSHLPPVGSLFAAFLGYNPMKVLLGSAALSHLSPATAHYLTSRSFFPRLIARPFGRRADRGFLFRRRRLRARCIRFPFARREVPLPRTRNHAGGQR